MTARDLDEPGLGGAREELGAATHVDDGEGRSRESVRDLGV